MKEKSAPHPRPEPPRATTGTGRVRGGAAARGSQRLELVLLAPFGGGSGGQLLATYDGARAVEEVATRGGEAGERMRRIIALHERILGTLRGKKGAPALPDSAELLEYGRLLFETLFPRSVRSLYDVARSRADGRLDVVFTSALDWLADKPWEFAYDPLRRRFLATEEVNFIRNVVTLVPADSTAPRRAPLRILVAMARPAGLALPSAGDEEAAIRGAFAPLATKGLATLDVAPAVTPEILHERVSSSRHDVLHFVGHGSYDEDARVGSLLLEDGRGGARAVDSRTLREILSGRGLSLVFLNACETGRGSRADFNRGVAPSLVAGGIPAVVANQYSVLDAAATAFASQLYAALARGQSLGNAAREARVAVRYSLPSESIGWAVPVVYARDPRLTLCRPPEGKRRGRRASPRRSGVRPVP